MIIIISNILIILIIYKNLPISIIWMWLLIMIILIIFNNHSKFLQNLLKFSTFPSNFFFLAKIQSSWCEMEKFRFYRTKLNENEVENISKFAKILDENDRTNFVYTKEVKCFYKTGWICTQVSMINVDV